MNKVPEISRADYNTILLHAEKISNGQHDFALPEISRADYNTILLHAEKISNGQHDFAPVLRRELHEKLNIADSESLISDLMTNSDIEILNRVRLFLSQFPFVIVGDEGAHYQLVKHGNFCELDLIGHSTEAVVNDTPAREPEGDDSANEPIELSVEETQAEVVAVTLEVRTRRISKLLLRRSCSGSWRQHLEKINPCATI